MKLPQQVEAHTAGAPLAAHGRITAQSNKCEVCKNSRLSATEMELCLAQC